MKQSQLNGDDARQENRIMIVDDDPDFGASLARLIELQGYQCTLAQSPSKAKKTAKNFDPQVALIDLRLGKDNGIDLIGELKESQPDILCVLMTAYASVDIAISALHQEVFEFLLKPIDDSALLTVLNRCFDRISLRLAKKKAEEELQRSEERFRLLVEGSPQGILIHKNLKPLFVNQSAVYTLGYASPEEFHREVNSIRELMHPDDRDRLLEFNMLRVRGNSVPNEYEAQFRHRDGSKIWVHLSIIMSEWQGERVNQTLFTDITERKRAESLLQQSEARFKDFALTAADWFWEMDADLRFTYISPNVEQVVGVPPEWHYGKTREELLGGEYDKAGWDEHLHALHEHRPFHEFEYLRVGDGIKPRWLSASGTPLFDAAGNFQGYRGTGRDITARKQVEADLRRSQTLMRTVFDTVPAGITVRDSEGRYILVNSTMAARYGLPAEEIVGRMPGEMGLSPEQDEESKHNNLEVFESGRTIVSPEKFVKLPNEEGGWRQVTRAPLHDEQGEVIGVVGVGIDITERKRVEDALRQSEENFRNTFDHSPSAILLKDVDGKYKIVNRRYEEWYDVSAKVIIGKTSHDIFPKEYADKFREQDEEVLDTGKIVERELEVPRADGSLSVVINTKFPVFGPDGKITGIGTISTDITERRRTENELHDHQRLLRTVIDTIPHWVYAKDAESRYLLVNQAMATSLGVTPQSMTGQKTQDFRRTQELRIGTDEELAALVEMDQHVMETGKSVDEKEIALTEPGGKQRIHHILKLPLLDESGAPVGVVGMSENITERKEMERQLRQSQKMEAVGQLAGGMAHDFNNMLQIIISYVHLANASIDSPEKLPKYLDNIGNSAGRAANLTRQLLTFSRKDVLQPKILDINDLISNLMKMLGRLLGENIEMAIIPGSELHAVIADPGMLEQVLVNLSVNARDAMPGGGRLVIETSGFHADEKFCRIHGWQRPGEYLLISVSDTGEGMTADVREHIFEPFYTTKEPGKGTGLGLSMVYSIIEQHEGIIAVYSEPGAGSSFRIYLPSIEGQTSTQEQQKARESPGGRETILIAEDEESVRELLSELLEAQGYRVLVAPDGEQAVSLYSSRKDSIDLVIMDVVMPKLSGRQAHDQIRGMNSRVPVVFSTGYAANTLDKEFLEQNGLRIIHKPYTPALLFQTVREAIDGASESSRGGSRTA